MGSNNKIISGQGKDSAKDTIKSGNSPLSYRVAKLGQRLNQLEGSTSTAIETLDEEIQNLEIPTDVFAEADTIYATLTGSDTDGDGSESKPYRTYLKAFEEYKKRSIRTSNASFANDPFDLNLKDGTVLGSYARIADRISYPKTRIKLGEGNFEDFTERTVNSDFSGLLVEGTEGLATFSIGKPNSGEIDSFDEATYEYTITVPGGETVWSDGELKGKFLKITLDFFGNLIPLTPLVPIIGNTAVGQVVTIQSTYSNFIPYSFFPFATPLYEIIDLKTTLTLSSSNINLQSANVSDTNELLINTNLIYNKIEFINPINQRTVLGFATYINCKNDWYGQRLNGTHMSCIYIYGNGWVNSQVGILTNSQGYVNLISNAIIRSDNWDVGKTTDDLTGYIYAVFVYNNYIEKLGNLAIRLSSTTHYHSRKMVSRNILNNTEIFANQAGSFNIFPPLLAILNNTLEYDDAGATNQMKVSVCQCKAFVYANRFKATFNKFSLLYNAEVWFANNTMDGACVDNYFFHLDSSCKIYITGNHPEGQSQQFIIDGAENGTLGGSQFYIDVHANKPYITTVAPVANNDKQDSASIGYSFKVGDIWINSAIPNDTYMCIDNSVGSAIWAKIA